MHVWNLPRVTRHRRKPLHSHAWTSSFLKRKGRQHEQQRVGINPHKPRELLPAIRWKKHSAVKQANLTGTDYV